MVHHLLTSEVEQHTVALTLALFGFPAIIMKNPKSIILINLHQMNINVIRKSIKVVIHLNTVLPIIIHGMVPTITITVIIIVIGSSIVAVVCLVLLIIIMTSIVAVIIIKNIDKSHLIPKITASIHIINTTNNLIVMKMDTGKKKRKKSHCLICCFYIKQLFFFACILTLMESVLQSLSILNYTYDKHIVLNWPTISAKKNYFFK